MKKYIQIISVLVVFSLLVMAKQSLSGLNNMDLGIGDQEERRQVVAPGDLVSAVPSASLIPSTINNNTTTVTTTTPAPTPKVQGQYRDGIYTGNIADAYYGYIQVQAIITGGKITDVKFLQYPNDNETSISINTQAMPYLKQETIQAQSAKVNTVSGASATSDAFRQSLSVALKQAV